MNDKVKPSGDLLIVRGSRGCGKTLMMQKWIDDFVKKHPDKKIVVVRAADLHKFKKEFTK